ncbi:hypothetical protein K435DRAFT_856024 [Dendrothele bispora CBS 962.96]|uniref:Uncharacterized protein n=1 Tax=Dendrothele bispora (strain CBS 962.96) TaxID=1314807 RepID=A0A4V4HGJ7_DENBC|nr:hypothetical protein K435DRAFT_856024 [Dendrothele bispora CBS 962.96]
MASRRSSRLLLKRFADALYPRLHTTLVEGLLFLEVDVDVSDIVDTRHQDLCPETVNQDPMIKEVLEAVELETYLQRQAASGANKLLPPKIDPPSKPGVKSLPSPRSSETVSKASSTPPSQITRPLSPPEVVQRPQKRIRLATELAAPQISYNLSFIPLVSRSDAKVTSMGSRSDSKGLARRHVRGDLRLKAKANASKTTGTMTFTASTPSTSSGKQFNVEASNISKPGWQGVHPNKGVRLALNRKWEDEDELRAAVKNCLPIPYYHPYTTLVYDNKSRLIIYRSRVLVRRHLPLSKINRVAADFVAATASPVTQKDMDSNTRGSHWYSILGMDRNNREEPQYSKFHLNNPHLMDQFFKQGDTLMELTEIGCGMMRSHFPQIWERFHNAAESLHKMYGIRPPFGVFWNFCLNSPRRGIKRVFCNPHIDAKNVALGLCMIFVYGHFDHSQKCWLVIWEAGIALELPPGVFLLYPSSLFIHFNIDLKDLPLYTTKNNEPPTRDNLQSLTCDCTAEAHAKDRDWQEASGRGSMVWFNQATMFQSAELGYNTIKQAREAGMNTDCPVNELLERGIFPINSPNSV